MSLTLCRGAWCHWRDGCPNYTLGYGAGVVLDSECRTVDRICRVGREEYHLAVELPVDKREGQIERA